MVYFGVIRNILRAIVIFMQKIVSVGVTANGCRQAGQEFVLLDITANCYRQADILLMLHCCRFEQLRQA